MARFEKETETVKPVIQYQVLTHWRDRHNHHHANPTRWYDDEDAARAAFTEACFADHDGEDYTVELLRTGGVVSPDVLDRWPTSPMVDVRPVISDLANRKRLP
jgi:hypothetical protein